MPIYVYHCNKCGKDVELLVASYTEREAQRCPECGSTEMTPQLTSFAVTSNAPTACGMKEPLASCPASGCGSCRRG